MTTPIGVDKAPRRPGRGSGGPRPGQYPLHRALLRRRNLTRRPRLNAAAAGAELIPGVRWRWVDETLWVLDKSAGVSVLADRAGAPSVHDALIAWHDAEAGRPRPRLVHRIDKDTSGLLLVALSATMERSLGAAFEARSIGSGNLAQASAPQFGDAREGAERHRITLPYAPDERAACESLGSGRQFSTGPGAASGSRCRLPWNSPGAERPHRRAPLGRATLSRASTHGRTHQIPCAKLTARSAAEGRCAYGRPSAAAGTAPWPACHALLPPEIADGISRPQRFTSPFPRTSRAARRALSAGAAPSRRACANPPRGQTHRAYLGPRRQRSALKLHGMEAAKEAIKPFIEGFRMAIGEGPAGQKAQFCRPHAEAQRAAIQ